MAAHDLTFATALAQHQPVEQQGRRWLFVPYDQLTDQLGPLSRHPPETLGIVLVECPAKAARRPYHKQKLALVLSNLRHFALEQVRRGVAVRHVVSRGDYAEALRPQCAELGTLTMMEAAERELRVDLQPLVDEGALRIRPHEGWLTTVEDFTGSVGSAPPWRMDAFYRAVRRRTGILMDARGKPEGGRFSFDGDNRKVWPGDPPAPALPRFAPDTITREVGDLVEQQFADHPGQLDLSMLPATAADAETLWRWARESCMTHFGPYEDAMSRHERNLFHTRISMLLNLHRLLPQRVIDDVHAMDVSLGSKEGFIRQILGWREFVRHVHRATDGFRHLLDGHHPKADPSHLGAAHPLPPAFWSGAPSGLACLDTVVESVWTEGYSHHITRLMVLSNLATLLDVSPRALTDWFWVAYTDAYDWVVEPNVLGMGTFAAGDVMTTKPYVSGAAYINKMSDYCEGCRFHPKKTCPITPLYWAFLARHADQLADNMRLKLPLASCRKRSPEKRAEDARIYRQVIDMLSAGAELTPERLQPAR
ncbi:MAG: cryptochrome/photolyase family protein [Bradymonadia bacterium]